MDYWARVAYHEARGTPHPVALQAARLLEMHVTPPFTPGLHLRNRVGEFRDMPDIPRPRGSRSVPISAELVSNAANVLEAVGTDYATRLARDLRAAVGEVMPTSSRRSFDLGTLAAA